MKLGEPSYITREDLPNAPNDPWIDVLLQHINSTNDEKAQALRQNLTVGDNMNAAIVTYRFTHGVERTIKNPLKGRPVGISAIRSTAVNGGVRYGLLGEPDWRFIDGTSATDPQQLGITVSYAQPIGRVDLYRDAAQSIASGGAGYPVEWNTQTYVPIGALSHSTSSNPGRITCARDGDVLITSTAWFAGSPGAGGGFWIQRSDTATRFWAASSGQWGALSVILPVSAGQWFEVYAFQSTGGPLNVTGAASPNDAATRLQARYVDVPATAQNDTTLVVYGG